MNAIEVNDLCYRYPGTDINILNDLNFTAKEGEVISIVGKSGCGKSTMLFCLNGIIPNLVRGKMSGQVKIFGKDINNLSVQNLGSDIQIMFQNPETQFFTFNVEDEIKFGLENKGLDEIQIGGEIEKVLKLINISHLLDRSVEELSSGEKQLVILASLIAMKPRILVLDEPTANLDPIQTENLKTILKKINQKYNTTIIAVEHDLDFAEISDKAFLFENGKLKKYNGELGQDYSAKKTGELSEKKEVLLKIRNLHYSYNENEILKGINFDVHRGEVLGLVGLNGSGKSTLIQNIIGILKPQKGEILFDNYSIIKNSVNKNAKNIGYVFQNPDYTLFENTVIDELKFGANNLGFEEEQVEKEIKQMLADLGLENIKEQDPDNLSMGQKRRVNISSILLMKPKILIIDEPSTGLDRINSIKLSKLLNELNSKGLTIVVVSHNIGFLQSLCDRFVYLDRGRVVDPKHYFDLIK